MKKLCRYKQIDSQFSGLCTRRMYEDTVPWNSRFRRSQKNPDRAARHPLENLQTSEKIEGQLHEKSFYCRISNKEK